MHRYWAALWLCGVIAGGAPNAARAFGPAGHEIAGLLAEPNLCPAAKSEIARLGHGRSLAELGLWADRIRSSPEWQHTGPWHYMNLPDAPAALGAALAGVRRFRHPPEGDVLWAIEHYRALLADASQSDAVRAEALKFVTHFVVDVHQPLHVGRAEDRGGNTIDVRYGAKTSNLHRFWDTDVIELAGLSVPRYVRKLTATDAWRRAQSAPPELDPAVWAAESLAARPRVYGFRRSGPGGVATLDDAYLARAQALIEERLALAGARLAATLNDALCAP